MSGKIFGEGGLIWPENDDGNLQPLNLELTREKAYLEYVTNRVTPSRADILDELMSLKSDKEEFEQCYNEYAGLSEFEYQRKLTEIQQQTNKTENEIYSAALEMATNLIKAADLYIYQTEQDNESKLSYSPLNGVVRTLTWKSLKSLNSGIEAYNQIFNEQRQFLPLSGIETSQVYDYNEFGEYIGLNEHSSPILKLLVQSHEYILKYIDEAVKQLVENGLYDDNKHYGLIEDLMLFVTELFISGDLESLSLFTKLIDSHVTHKPKRPLLGSIVKAENKLSEQLDKEVNKIGLILNKIYQGKEMGDLIDPESLLAAIRFARARTQVRTNYFQAHTTKKILIYDWEKLKLVDSMLQPRFSNWFLSLSKLQPSFEGFNSQLSLSVIQNTILQNFQEYSQKHGLVGQGVIEHIKTYKAKNIINNWIIAGGLEEEAINPLNLDKPKIEVSVTHRYPTEAELRSNPTKSAYEYLSFIIKGLKNTKMEFICDLDQVFLLVGEINQCALFRLDYNSEILIQALSLLQDAHFSFSSYNSSLFEQRS